MRVDAATHCRETLVAMPVVFTDSDGRQGRITDELSVEYEGHRTVEQYVQAVQAESPSTEATVEELIIGLVQDLGLEEARRAPDHLDEPRP